MLQSKNCILRVLSYRVLTLVLIKFAFADSERYYFWELIDRLQAQTTTIATVSSSLAVRKKPHYSRGNGEVLHDFFYVSVELSFIPFTFDWILVKLQLTSVRG